MIKSRYYILGFIIILVFLGAGPIVINELMFKQDWYKVKGDEVLWIPSLATYFGAIIGGVISGLLTLLGVKLTIKSSTDQVSETIIEQQKMRTEELVNKAIKDQLFRLYHPLNSKIHSYIFKYGAHDFSRLNFEEQIDFMDFITENEIYAEKNLYIKILEIRWAFKEGDYKRANDYYHEIWDLLTESIHVMKEQLKLPNQEI